MVLDGFWLSVFWFVLAFIVGALVKWVDIEDDEKKQKSNLRYVTAVAYGVIIGYLISVAPFSMLFLGALAAQVFAKKTDTYSHLLALLIAVLTSAIIGFPVMSLPFFLYFFVLAFLDEIPYVQKFGLMPGHRILLQIGSLVLVFIGQWQYFVAIILFDGGYLLVQKFCSPKEK